MAWRRAMGGVLGLVLWMLATPVQARAEFDLIGTWYVLIHYKDSATHNPDVDRWLDKIWTFKQKGSRLEWTEYPIVVFIDQTGRFERYRGVRSRVLAYWQPNATQMAQIKGGLEINNRGSKSKSLRGSPSRGYKTASRMRTQSASVIGYVENWSIEDVEGKPIFTFDDVMGSGRTENMEGRTRYTTTAVGDGGDLLEGTYNRDGTRIGTFQLIRAGQVARVAGKSKKVAEERQQLFIEGIQRQVERGEIEDIAGPGEEPVSAGEKEATKYIFSLPKEQRDKLLAELEGKSPAERAIVMREHVGKEPVSAEEKAVIEYIFSLPKEQRDKLLAELEGKSPAEGALVVREHYEKLPPGQQKKFRAQFGALGSGPPPGE